MGKLSSCQLVKRLKDPAREINKILSLQEENPRKPRKRLRVKSQDHYSAGRVGFEQDELRVLPLRWRPKCFASLMSVGKSLD